ncbi:NAD(P)/FAD-dependent oxidoreductase [Streptomyces sp. NPDC054796]
MEDTAMDQVPHALVIGAGPAGLLAACALAQRFERVSVIERDPLPDRGPAFRPGIPQSRHLHILWEHGLRLIEELMPGFTRATLGAGGTLVTAPSDALWLSPEGWFTRAPGRTRVLSCSRDLINWILYRTARANERITILSGRRCTGLLASPSEEDVVGVTMSSDSADEQLRADLVVDATGRTSRATAWLQALGYPVPQVTHCRPHLAYSSRLYARPPGERDWRAIYLQSHPGSMRAGVLMPIEADRWIVSVSGHTSQQLPVTDHEFLTFARSLRAPHLYQALCRAQPLTQPTRFAAITNEWRHYETMPRWPHGFLVIGDALCTLNPVYGHGMTVAAITAHHLADALKPLRPTDVPRRTRRLQKTAARSCLQAWTIATTEDLRYPTTDGLEAGFVLRLRQRAVARALAAANTDPAVADRLFSVFSLAAPPTTLLSPFCLPRLLLPRPDVTPPPSPTPRPT